MKFQFFAATAIAVAGFAAHAQDGESLFGVDSASVTYGPYIRAELGAASSNAGSGLWHPPGASDPTIFFSPDVDNGAVGALAFGFDWQNGYRGEFAITGFGDVDAPGTCSGASDASSCSIHADISSASVSSTAALFNVYYSPREASGNSSRVQPFVTAGLGFSRNRMSDWTRTNASATQVDRTFEGASNTDLAWSIGAGVAMELDRDKDWPVILEATYRYFDLGTAVGGSTPLAGSGSSEPLAPYQFKNRNHVLSIGIRIPLKRY